MSKLAVRTRGNSSPQGKPRVYFSCHPDDFPEYFESLCGDIFDTQNCAIYYESDWENELDGAAAADETTAAGGTFESDNAALASELADMQLFVVPLTTNFLFTPCRARDFEYGFAIEHHIPVIPIAVEEGIDQFFADCMNKIGEGYGDIQFLNKVSRDNTELPYEEKLQKLLNSILIGDELAKRVRAAFDAYIFLSYRKKDRVYAKELMKLIHRIPYCRDIAIWYDEFLVPGEGWNEAIREAMDKSSLVTLAVTPSIVEPDNFIINHEYPDAVSIGKEIVPAEILPTDRDALARLFQGISNPVDGRDAKAMETALQSLAVQENDRLPEHNFLIGLAFLGAIDVERDPERAAALITSAAEAGLPEAIQKLVSMYNTGEGVERSYLTAVEWQERLIAVLEKQNEGYLPTDDIMYAMRDAGEMWEALGMLDRAESDYTRMEQAAQKCVDAYSAPETLRDLSLSYESLGKIYELKEDIMGAESYYEKMMELDEKLAAEDDLFDHRRDLAICYNHMGQVFEKAGYLDQANEFYEESLRLREELAEENAEDVETEGDENIDSRRNLSVGYDNLGGLCEARDDLDGALEYYEKSLQIDKGLADETGIAEDRRSLSIQYRNVGRIYEAYGDLDEAQAYYEKSLALAEKLADETGTVGDRNSLSLCYDKLGGIARAREDLDEAQAYYEKSLRIDEELAAKTSTPNARRNLSVVYDKLGRLLRVRGDLDGAQAYCEKSLQILMELVQETKNMKASRDLAVSYGQLGGILRARGDLTGARSYFEKSLTILEALAEQTEVEVRRNLSIGYEDLGGIYEADGDYRTARMYYEKDHKLCEELAAEANTVGNRRDLAFSCSKLGDAYAASGDLSAARTYYEKSLALRTELAKKLETAEAYDELGISYYKLGMLGDKDAAALEKSYEIYCALADNFPDVQRFQELKRILASCQGTVL